MAETKQATINLPEGMDAAKVKAILDSYQKKSTTQGAKNKAKREATTLLINAHDVEYKAFLVQTKKANGVS